MKPPSWMRGLAGVVAGAALVARAVEPIPVAAAAEATPQVLFMGTDVVILKDRDFHRVVAISDGAYVIEQRGRLVRVPLASRDIRLKVEPSLKLSGVSVDVDKLRTAQGYTPATDPRRKRLAAAGQAAGSAAAVDLATDTLITATAAQQNVFITGTGPQETLSALGQQTATAEGARLSVASQQVSAADQADRLVGDLTEERYDAMEVDFELSSETPLADAAVVVVMRYRHRGAPRGMERDMIHAQSLDGLDRTPRKISVRQGGFPAGFVLDEVQVHVYDGGREVASNVAPKRVALGREDAFQYLLMEHVSANRGRSVAAAPALGSLSAEQRAAIPPDQLERTFHVKVGKDGRPLGTYADADLRVRVEDGPVTEALAQILFTPALENGRPVDGVAAVRLDRLAR